MQQDGKKEMPKSEFGFTDRLGEQLFKAGPGSRCFAVATKGNAWLKMDIAGRQIFSSCIPFLTTTSPFPKKNTKEGSVHYAAIRDN